MNINIKYKIKTLYGFGFHFIIPINNSLVFNQSEHPWLFIASLGCRCNAANLDKTKTYFKHAIHAFPMFVEACGKTHGIGKHFAKDLRLLFGKITTFTWIFIVRTNPPI
jgi:hypothetical protein